VGELEAELPPFYLKIMTLLYIMIVATVLLKQDAATNHPQATTMQTATEIVSPNILTVKLNERQLKNFWSKVNKDGPVPDQSIEHYKGLDACWIWTASKLRGGYGQFMMNYKMMKAHRVSFLISNGFLNQEIRICHKCDLGSCVNPSHLFEGTDKDNSDDRDSKGRTASGDRSGARLHPERLIRGTDHWAHKNPEKCRRGDNHPFRINPLLAAHGQDNAATKLTEDQVREIRSAYVPYKVSQQQLAERYGVAQTLISAIIRKEIWQHI
jgi:hypothetical protein